MFRNFMFCLSSIGVFGTTQLHTQIESPQTTPFGASQIVVSEKEPQWQWSCITKGCEYVSNIHDSYTSACRYAVAHSQNYRHAIKVVKLP
ncbi:hypothetical protein [Xylocopilactobacillus apis]|uniref:Secreted protein n=1 Tax=Xylocopilactobacillus apis TaxID=2932183 RepID=A0AAU9DLD9_9LACO|nr:hypothetical protein [Xylocopilactobacillus apis]BDR55628.1 hypothetical protein KIMC2_01900 [Xylocopilactobacillus apis]